jgi:hypothetical protein
VRWRLISPRLGDQRQLVLGRVLPIGQQRLVAQRRAHRPPARGQLGAVGVRQVELRPPLVGAQMTLQVAGEARQRQPPHAQPELARGVGARLADDRRLDAGHRAPRRPGGRRLQEACPRR